MVKLLSFLFDVLNVLFDLELLLSSLERIRKEKFAIESPDLLCILEEFAIGLSQLFFFLFLLEPFLIFIYFSTL